MSCLFSSTDQLTDTSCGRTCCTFSANIEPILRSISVDWYGSDCRAVTRPAAPATCSANRPSARSSTRHPSFPPTVRGTAPSKITILEGTRTVAVNKARMLVIAASPYHVPQSIGNESVPIQWTQCWFPGLAISNAEILIYISNKIHGRNFIKQHLETVIVWYYQNVDCSLRKKILLCHLL